MMNFIHIVLNELTCPYCRLIIRIKAGFVELRREGVSAFLGELEILEILSACKS
jgi:hypothetical protein